MARNRTPQTFMKRQREIEKQRKRAAKQADRLARNAAKREAKDEEDRPTGTVDFVDMWEDPPREEPE